MFVFFVIGLQIQLDKKVCEQTLSWLAKAGPESFKKFEKFYKFKF